MAEGTVVPQKDVDRGGKLHCSMGTEQRFVMFSFAKVPLVEITGIVFRKEGTLYFHPIAVTDWRPIRCNLLFRRKCFRASTAAISVADEYWSWTPNLD